METKNQREPAYWVVVVPNDVSIQTAIDYLNKNEITIKEYIHQNRLKVRCTKDVLRTKTNYEIEEYDPIGWLNLEKSNVCTVGFIDKEAATDARSDIEAIGFKIIGESETKFRVEVDKDSIAIFKQHMPYGVEFFETYIAPTLCV